MAPPECLFYVFTQIEEDQYTLIVSTVSTLGLAKNWHLLIVYVTGFANNYVHSPHIQFIKFEDSQSLLGMIDSYRCETIRHVELLFLYHL